MVVALAAPFLVRREADALRELMVSALTLTADPSPEKALDLLGKGLGQAVLALLLLGAGIALIGVAAALAQGGFYLATKAVKPSFAKLNPIKGAARVLGPHALWEGAKMLLKTSVVAALVWSSVKSLMPLIGGMVAPAVVLDLAGDHVLGLLRNVALAGLVMAVADYAYQRKKVGKKARMTKDEVRREMKQTEGDPLVKAAIRSRQLAAARQRM